MSGKKNRQRRQRETGEQQGVWVTSDLNPDGSTDYIVTVSANDDCALSLKADAAVRYCAAVTRAATIAQHDAAVLAQLTRVGISAESAGLTVVELRQDREPVADAATAPLRFEPIVSGSSGKPYVLVWAGAERISQWTPRDCFQHAGHVMQVLAGVDLDSAYFRYLVGTIGTDPQRARAAVHDLGSYRTGLRD
jgi:hypothetical protein